jgi:hypothetical protein
MDLATFESWSDQEQHDYLSESVERILALPGIDRSFYPDVLIEYEISEDEDQIYMRMMSKGGHTDDSNCLVLKNHLRSIKVPFGSTSDRNVIMRMTDFLKVF